MPLYLYFGSYTKCRYPIARNGILVESLIKGTPQIYRQFKKEDWEEDWKRSKTRHGQFVHHNALTRFCLAVGRRSAQRRVTRNISEGQRLDSERDKASGPAGISYTCVEQHRIAT